MQISRFVHINIFVASISNCVSGALINMINMFTRFLPKNDSQLVKIVQSCELKWLCRWADRQVSSWAGGVMWSISLCLYLFIINAICNLCLLLRLSSVCRVDLNNELCFGYVAGFIFVCLCVSCLSVVCCHKIQLSCTNKQSASQAH